MKKFNPTRYEAPSRNAVSGALPRKKPGLFFIMLCCLLLTTLPAFAQDFVYRIPDTGQTKCYDDKKEIPCPKPGEPFYGQDGNYSINPMSFTKLDEKSRPLPDNAEKWVMVKDNNTGLIWEVKTDDGSVHDKDNTYNWQDAKDVFIRQLNKEKFGGFSDWRLPEREELRSIAEYGQTNPVINERYFSNTVSSYYWSSTTYASSTGSAWNVNFVRQ